MWLNKRIRKLFITDMKLFKIDIAKSKTMSIAYLFRCKYICMLYTHIHVYIYYIYTRIFILSE